MVDTQQAEHEPEFIEEGQSREQLPPENLGLVIAHIPFARKLALQFCKRRLHFGIEREDFESAALLGLVDAARRFDRRKGMSFKTFCYFRVRGTMFDLLRRGGGMPRREFRRLVKLQKEEQRCANGNGAKIESSEIKALEEKAETLPYSFAKSAEELASLIETIDEIGIRLHLGSDNQVIDLSYSDDITPELHASIQNTRVYLEELMARLPEAQRKVVRLRYWDSLSFEEIRHHCGGASKSWVSRVHMKALDAMREMVVTEETQCRLRAQRASMAHGKHKRL